MLQTLHLMQQQKQQQQQQTPQLSSYDPSFRPLIQSNSGFGTLSVNGGAAHLTTAASYFPPPPQPPPPPPDQPLPPLPPITPTSGVSCGTHRPSSTVNPYAASSAVSILANGGAVATTPMIASTHTGEINTLKGLGNVHDSFTVIVSPHNPPIKSSTVGRIDDSFKRP